VRSIQSFFELNPATASVHAVHGYARFVGLKRFGAHRRRGGAPDLVFREDVTL
jgi:hypothetical protein